jgi:carboxyl-terminal processing protease
MMHFSVVLRPGCQQLTSLVFLFLFSTSVFASTPTEIAPTPEQSRTTIDILNKLEERHYRDLPVDDKLSQDFLERYLDSLDPSNLFFYSADIEKFEKSVNRFDDLLKNGKLDLGFNIFNVYRQRVVSRLEQVLAELSDPEVKFDFAKNGTLNLDPDEAHWPKSQAEADEIWHKRIKLNLLNLKLAGKTATEAKSTLHRRYKNQLNRVLQQNSEDVFEVMINSLTMLYDPHTNYFSPRTSENFKINMSLSLEGIGAVLQSEDEHTKVVRLVAGGPADMQGQLDPADRIIGVAQGDDGEMVDIVGWRLDEVVELIRGPKDTIVRLEVLPPESSAKLVPETIRIKRGKVKLEDQAARKATFELTDGNQIYKVGVIEVPAFYIDFEAYHKGDPDYKSTTRDVAILLDQLKKENVDGIILDLRNNGGGSLTEATMLTDLFIDQGPVVQIRESDNHISRYNRSRFSARYRGPLIVLVNRLSASASEIFAGAIQDYNRGLIVGSQTFGKGTVQSLTPVVEGRLKLTESKFYRVSGDSTQHRGVIPDISLPVLIDQDEVGESAYDNALPWDQIHDVAHEKYFDFSRVVPLLTNLHKKRVATDPDFIYLLDQLELQNANKDRTIVSLNEEDRRKEKETLETMAMAIDNKRRIAKELEPYKTLEEFRTAEEAEVKKDEEAAATSADIEITLAGDTLLNETGYIMVDMISLFKEPELKQASNGFLNPLH